MWGKMLLGRLLVVVLPVLLLVACVTQAPVVEKSPPPSSETDAETAVALRDGATGRILAGVCFGCHGPEGRSQAPAIPSLAGLPLTYLVKAMESYQYGGRYSTIMGRIAAGFTQQEIYRLARYFSQQDNGLIRQSVDWSLVRQGRHLHRLYCQECHGDLASRPNHDAARLNGQWMSYLRWTLHDYLIGINQSEAGMSEQFAKLIRQQGSAGLEALVHYYGSARP
jgi:sulfide dehydrogenase cytochrome subunit